jgi:hypothetical protein
MKIAGLLVFINDVHSLGLKTTAGPASGTDSWYWDQTTRRAPGQALLRQVQAHALDGAGRRLLGHA